jgi:hypothetical protein
MKEVDLAINTVIGGDPFLDAINNITKLENPCCKTSPNFSHCRYYPVMKKTEVKCPFKANCPDCVILDTYHGGKNFNFMASLAFLCSITVERRKIGILTDEKSFEKNLSELLSLLLKYKAALELQFEEYLGEENAETI